MKSKAMDPSAPDFIPRKAIKLTECIAAADLGRFRYYDLPEEREKPLAEETVDEAIASVSVEGALASEQEVQELTIATPEDLVFNHISLFSIADVQVIRKRLEDKPFVVSNSTFPLDALNNDFDKLLLIVLMMYSLSSRLEDMPRSERREAIPGMREQMETHCWDLLKVLGRESSEDAIWDITLPILNLACEGKDNGLIDSFCNFYEFLPAIINENL